MQFFVSSLAAPTARGKSSLNNALHHGASSWPNDEESMFVSVTEFLLRICVESFFSDPTQTVRLVQQKDPISCMEDQRICHVDITAKQSTYPPCLALTERLFYKCLYIFQICFVHMYLFIMLLLQYSMY